MSVSSERLTVPEVARRLGLPGPEVYELIFAGELDGKPDAGGAVYVTEAALVNYEQKIEDQHAHR